MSFVGQVTCRDDEGREYEKAGRGNTLEIRVAVRKKVILAVIERGDNLERPQRKCPL